MHQKIPGRAGFASRMRAGSAGGVAISQAARRPPIGERVAMTSDGVRLREPQADSGSPDRTVRKLPAAQAPRLAAMAPRDVMLSLQCRAGNKAVAAALVADGSSAPRSLTPLQRAIGFEFELGSWRSRRAKKVTLGFHGQGRTYHENRALAVPAQWRKYSSPIKKGVPIIDDVNGWFSLQAEEAGPVSSLEIVTGAFPETPGGKNALVAALNRIDMLGQALMALNAPIDSASNVGVGNQVLSHVLIQPGVGQADVQTTFGVSLQNLTELLKDLATNASMVPRLGETGPEQLGRATGRQQLTGRMGGTGVQSFGIAAFDAQQAAAAYPALDPGVNAVAGFPSAQLLSVLAMVVAYLRQAMQPKPTYAKASFPLLVRTDFFTLHSQMPEHAYFTGPRWEALVQQAPSLAAYNFNLPVFEGGIWTSISPTHTGSQVLGAVTRTRWLQNMPQRDLLTAAQFPGSKSAKGELESMGRLGGTMDTDVGPGGIAGNRPILELRPVQITQLGAPLTALALRIFKYVRRLNRPGAHRYYQ